MLKKQIVKQKWNSKTKRWYVEKGYNFTRMGDEFYVDANDLTPGSNVNVAVICDYCGREYQTQWYNYQQGKNVICKASCNSNECKQKKAQEVNRIKHGGNSPFSDPFVQEKAKNKFKEKYGCDNPFENEEVKARIKETNLRKYGVACTMQNPEVVKKSQKTCMEKYGVKNYGAIYSNTHAKELSPTWKGGVEYHGVERSTLEYRRWRSAVLERDECRCVKCGRTDDIEVHHIADWVNHIDKRYDIANGATLCRECHYQFHSLYGKKENNENQFEEFLKL